MPKFFYEALDKGGRSVKGETEAGTAEEIVRRLRAMGHYPLRVLRHRRNLQQVDIFALPGLRNIFHRIKTRHIVTFSRQLATLIDAGLPILRSLTILQDQVESVIFKQKIAAMSRSIEQGSTLSDAMAPHKKVFDKLYVSTVRAGELGGVLETVLQNIADYKEKRLALVSRVRAALMYPLAVLTLATVIISIILIFVMPKFAVIYAELHAELPWLTQQMIYVSGILSHHFWIVLLSLAALVLIYKKINTTRDGKYVIDRLKLRLPVFGELIRKTAVARFAGVFSTMISAGVPILQAIEIVRETSGNEVISRVMDKIHQNVRDGETIHEPMLVHGSRVFSPMIVHMVAVGEETGALDHMLRKVAEAYQRDVDDTVDGLSALLEPLLMVFLGVTIGTVVIALYLPLFDMIRHIQ